MTELNEQDLRGYRERAEHTRDAPLSDTAGRPGQQRAKVLSVRLNPEEFDELTRCATAVDVSVSALVRGWLLKHLRTAAESPANTVDRIAHELEELRRQLTS
ncbi:MAG: plasmid mobilization protein [Trebonia sp.]